MFRKIPLILLTILIILILFEPWLPLLSKQLLYSFSITIKSSVILLLPLIIFSLLFSSIVSLSCQVSQLISVIIMLVCGSNLLSTLISHFLGSWIYQWNNSLPPPPKTIASLSPLWQLNFPVLISNEFALLSGLLFGLLAAKKSPKNAQMIARYLKRMTDCALSTITYLIPLFIAGLVIKLKADGTLLMLIRHYGMMFGFIACVQYSYVLLVYWLLAGGCWRRLLTLLHNLLPAALSGLCTMSSAASLPLTLMGVKQCAHDQQLVETVVPTTVNIHLLGDCLAIPILSYAILKAFNMPEPTFIQYLLFAIYFVLAKFSVAAIPGGGIIVMLPLLEKHLGMTPVMLSLITALYMLFDPIITSVNILGNGALALVIDRLHTRNHHT